MRQLSLYLLLGASAGAAAQLPSLPVGQRIRVDMDLPRARVAGALISQTDDSLFIAYQNARRSIESSTIVRISASSGKSRPRGAMRGLKVGAVIGGGLTLLVFGSGYLVASRRADDIPALAGWTVGGTLTGAVYGTLIGAAIGAERWTPVYTRPAPQPGFGFAPKF